MNRRVGVIFAAAVLLVAAWAGSAQAAAPPGPRLLISALALPGKLELFTTDASGGARETLYSATGKTLPVIDTLEAPSWAPDGTGLAVAAITGEHHGRFISFPKTMLALIRTEGGGLETLEGGIGGIAPVVSPDGRRIAFAKAKRRWRPNKHGGADKVYESVSIWMLDLAARSSTQLTPWRNHLVQAPSSFSPDGTHLGFTREVGDHPPQALAMSFDGSPATVLADDASGPTYAPDGRQVAFLRGPERTKVRRWKSRRASKVSITTARMTDIFVLDLGSGALRRLTKTPQVAELEPRWDPSGQRLAFIGLEPFAAEESLLGFGDSINEINADGTCDEELLSTPHTVYSSATWQPGQGREAGPIAC